METFAQRVQFNGAYKAVRDGDMAALARFSGDISRFNAPRQRQLLFNYAASGTVAGLCAFANVSWCIPWQRSLFLGACEHANVDLVRHLAPELPTLCGEGMARAAYRATSESMEIVRFLADGMKRPESALARAADAALGHRLTARQMQNPNPNAMLDMILGRVSIEQVMVQLAKPDNQPDGVRGMMAFVELLEKALEDPDFRERQLGMKLPSDAAWRDMLRLHRPDFLARLDVFRIQGQVAQLQAQTEHLAAPRRQRRL